jgi:hypothetical protein
MKRSSWEIILAGFIFVGLAIYIAENTSNKPATSSTTAISDSIIVNMGDENLRVIKLDKLENLKELEKLKELENLEDLKNLENLKNIGNFLPAEIRKEFESGIDEAMKSLEEENIQVDINTEDGTVSIKEAMSIDGSAGWTTVSPGVFAYSKEFDASQFDNSEIILPFGSIEVLGKAVNTGKLTIQASGQIATKKELQSLLEVKEEFDRKTAKIELHSNTNSNKNNNIHLQAILHVPENMSIKAHTKGGHIKSDNISGDQEYETHGGHITLNALAGNVDANTSGGHISISESEGQFLLKSLGGHISAKNTSGDLAMQTSGGNIQATGISGKTQAKTNGGNIELEFKNVDGNINAYTGAGTITFLIPTSTNANLHLSGNSVEIPSSFSFSGDRSSDAVKGSIGNGGFKLTAKTNYGKVIIKARDN